MTTIPPITNPLGKYWNQPKLSEIEVYDNQVMMSEFNLQKLHTYQTSIPTGAYIGKMWKRKFYPGGRWLLCWYDTHPDPNLLSIKTRKIVVNRNT